jgi:hypothetical protein
VSVAARSSGSVRPDGGAATVRSPVLLIVGGGTVSRAAICLVSGLAGDARVTVLGVGVEAPGDPAGEPVRRAVAQAMSALDHDDVMALGHISVTGSPARTIARMARARGARSVVLDQMSGLADGLAGELRRRLHGSGIAVVAATEHARPTGPP